MLKFRQILRLIHKTSVTNTLSSIENESIEIRPFYCFISHGYLPSEFMKTAIVPIIKDKTGDTSDKNKYRPIALVTACSKIFELCILFIIEDYICTHDHQFGFKKQHAIDMCIYTIKV